MAARIPARPVIAAKPAPAPRAAVAPRPVPAPKPPAPPKPAPTPKAAPKIPESRIKLMEAQKAAKEKQQQQKANPMVMRENARMKKELDAANKKIKELTPAAAGEIPAFSYPAAATEAPRQLDIGTATGSSSSSAEIDKLMGIINSMQANPAPTDAGVNDALTIAQNTKIGGGATGFSRKQSKARRAGMVGKGTSRLSIRRQGPNLGSSGLNIGY